LHSLHIIGTISQTVQEQDRVRLLYGPYEMPNYKVGGWLRCRMRGKVRVAGLTDAPIP
jgi:hypothetical protein